MGGKMLARAAALAVLLVAGGAWAWHISSLERRMVMAAPDALPADVADYAVRSGAEIFARHCQDCHGDGKRARAAGVPVLADNDWLYGAGTVGDIEQTVAHGIRAANGKSRNLALMPAYATARPSPTEAIPPLTPADINDVVNYLMKIGGGPADDQAAGRGAAIYLDRGGCYDCHGADAKGDPAIGAPDLTDTIWLTGDGSRDALLNTIARGAARMCPAWAGVLSAAEVRAVAVYVHSLSHASSPR
jgi:cytochrome c oxidase cbb3-type subunit 3